MRDKSKAPFKAMIPNPPSASLSLDSTPPRVYHKRLALECSPTSFTSPCLGSPSRGSVSSADSRCSWGRRNICSLRIMSCGWRAEKRTGRVGAGIMRHRFERLRRTSDDWLQGWFCQLPHLYLRCSSELLFRLLGNFAGNAVKIQKKHLDGCPQSFPLGRWYLLALLDFEERRGIGRRGTSGFPRASSAHHSDHKFTNHVKKPRLKIFISFWHLMSMSDWRYTSYPSYICLIVCHSSKNASIADSANPGFPTPKRCCITISKQKIYLHKLKHNR